MAKIFDATDASFVAASKCGAFKGAVKNLNNNAYHSLKDYWSSTHLKFMHSTSPAHFKEKYMKPSEPEEPSKAMILGSLVHTLLLTPDEFEKDFFLMPSLNLRTNEGKAAKEEILSKNAGKQPVTDEMLIQARAMRSSALANKEVVKLLEPGLKEAAFFWTCPFSNLNFKAKLDHSSSLHWCEVKTTSSAQPEEFARHAYNMHYDLSLFHYREGLKQVMDITPKAYFIVIENEAPYVTQVYAVGDGFWETGHSKWLAAVSALADGIQKDNWRGYFPTEGFETPVIDPPAWAVNKLMKGEIDGI